MDGIAGLHYRQPKRAALSEADARQVEFIFGGLHWRAERLIEAVFANAGYRARALPTATRQDLLTGRELADIGQCCPTSFTTGNLANFLKSESERIGAEEVQKRYVYFTCGSCGACRFGQYHQSYDLALANLGLERFRMMILDQNPLALGGDDPNAFRIDMPIAIGAVWGAICGDLIQGLEYRIRPYEVEPGATDRAARQAVDLLVDAFRNRPKRGKRWGNLAWHVASPYFADAMRQARAFFDDIQVDRLRPKPVVQITGEFYLHSVEGDPNYNMHAWLESEGAEAIPATIALWMDYLVRWAKQETENRRATLPDANRRMLLARATGAMLHFTHNRLRRALNNVPDPLPDQEEIRALAAPYYHRHMSGGEGDMLIGKALYAHIHKHAHMVCELSPYGCLPNTMSVGAMANALGKHPDLLYAPIEVKGDAEIHALSRCQMILTEAKKRAAAEFEKALKTAGMTLDQARERAANHPDLRRATWRVPHLGVAGTGANAVLHMAGRRTGA